MSDSNLYILTNEYVNFGVLPTVTYAGLSTKAILTRENLGMFVYDDQDYESTLADDREWRLTD